MNVTRITKSSLVTIELVQKRFCDSVSWNKLLYLSGYTKRIMGKEWESNYLYSDLENSG